MRTKRRCVDVLSVKLEEETITFKEILETIDGRNYRYNEKIFNFSLLSTHIRNCIIGIIITTQDSDIPPKRNKQTGEYQSVEINTEEEGFAYANIILYDYHRNILLYEINKSGCYPNQFIDFLKSYSRPLVS